MSNTNKNINFSNINSKVDGVFDSITEKRQKPVMENNGVVKTYSTESITRSKFDTRSNKTLRMLVLLSIAVAVIIFAIFWASTVGEKIVDSGNIEENIHRQVNFQLVPVSIFLGASQAQAQEIMSEQGLSFVSMTSNDDTSNSYDLYKIPIDCEVSWAQENISKGFTKMGLVNASKLLAGGWQLSADKEATNWARIRYADFESLDSKEAINKALASQNFENIYETNDDVDELGNTYKAGTAKYEGMNISWRVSAIALVEVYDIGLPDSAIFVGIRVELV